MLAFRKNTLAVTCGLALAAGCASVDRANPKPLAVVPVTNVTHSMATASANYQIGRYYQDRNRYDAAIDAYRKSLEAKPDNADAHNGLGIIYANQGNYAEASIELRSAMAITPAAAYIYNNLGYTYLLEGKNAEALTVLKLASGLDPDNRRVRDNIEIAMKRLGEKTADPSATRQAATGEAWVAAAPAKPTNSGSPGTTKLAGANSATLPPAAAMRTPERIELSTSVQSRMEIVQLAPNVFEVRMPAEKASALPRAGEAREDHSGQLAVKTFRLEVSNGNGTSRLARRVSRLLLSKGMPAARLTNQKPFRQAYTEIQYRPGFLSYATGLRTNIKDMASVVEQRGLKPGTDVRLVLGKDDATILAIVEALGGLKSVVQRVDDDAERSLRPQA